MKKEQLLNSALGAFDQIAYQLDQYGIVPGINRHQVIAYLMAEQKRLEGELDCLNARASVRRLQVEQILGQIGNTARGGVDLVLTPARSTASTVRRLLGAAPECQA